MYAGDYQPFRIVETCQPLTSQVDFAAFRIHADPQGSRRMGTCKARALVCDYQPFRIVETCQPLTSQVDFAAFRIHADPQGSRAHGGLARLTRSLVTRKPFRAWADSSPLFRERLFGSSKLWRLERLDFHMQTSAYSARTWTASEATFAGRLGLLIAKLGAHPRTPKLLNCNVLRFQSAKFLNSEVRISM